MSAIADFFLSPILWGLSLLQLFGLYALPGIGYLSFQLVREYRDCPSEFAKEILEAFRGKKTITDYLGDALVFSIAALSICFAWPAFFMWAYIESRREAVREIERNKPDFFCLSEHLIKKVDPVDAEITSYVIDPLGTVPLLPFGHLNKGWVYFLADMTDEGDEMWSFFIPKGSESGKYRHAATSDIRGFAKIRNGQILGEFITESD